MTETKKEQPRGVPGGAVRRCRRTLAVAASAVVASLLSTPVRAWSPGRTVAAFPASCARAVAHGPSLRSGGTVPAALGLGGGEGDDAGESSSSATRKKNSKRAVVVGGGPVGLASALVLASEPHGYNVDVFEASGGGAEGDDAGGVGGGGIGRDVSKYDPTRAFVYRINSRGQSFTSRFPTLQRLLEERGVAQKGAMMDIQLYVVPGDPNRAIEVGGSASKKTNDRKMSEEEREAEEKEALRQQGFWIPRHEMVGIMRATVDEFSDSRDEDTTGRIVYHTGRECVAVRPTNGGAGGDDGDGDSVEVVVRPSTASASADDDEVHRAALVIGADGVNSKVRECLATANAQDFTSEGWGTKGLGGIVNAHRSQKFRVRQYRSPASGLRVKVLQFPPRFTIPNCTDDIMETSSQQFMAIRSMKTNPRDFLSLGLLPIKDNDAPRPTNVITRPDHNVWKFTDGPSVKAYFSSQYPRFRFVDDESSSNDEKKRTVVVSDDEWDRFAKAKGTRFPPCQYSPGLAVHSPSGTAGVALVGDAAHAYPPDIGQGINSGLADVVALDRSLRGLDCVPPKQNMSRLGGGEEKGNASTPLSEALSTYQTQREPEMRALIRLARFGAPYQYRQPHRIDRIRRTLWTANVILRVLLHKVTFGLTAEPCIILAQDDRLTFREVMQKADRTTVGIVGACMAVAAGIAYQVGRKNFFSLLCSNPTLLWFTGKTWCRFNLF